MRLSRRTGVTATVALGGALLLALGLHAAALSPPWLDGFGDEATEALAALTILEGEWPVFFYGQAYMGSLANYPGALLFFVLGISPWTLKFQALLLYLVLIGVSGLLAWRALSPAAGAWAALLVAFPPPPLFRLSHEARSYTNLIPLFGVLLVLTVLPLLTTPERARQGRRWLVLGLLVGLAWWVNFASIAFLLPVGLAVLLVHPRAIRQWAVVAAGFGLGSAPFWVYNMTHWGQSLWWLAGAGEAVPVGEHLRLFLTVSFPALVALAFRPPGALGVAWIAVVAVAALAIGNAVRRGVQGVPRREPSAIALVLLLGIAATSAASGILTTFGGRFPENPAYYLAFYAVLPTLTAALIEDLRRLWRPLGWIALGLMVGFGGLQDVRWVRANRATAEQYETRQAHEAALRATLDRAGVAHVYQLSNVELTVKWAGAVTVADPYQAVYPPHADRVDAAERIAIVLRDEDAPFVAPIRESLRGAGIRFEETTVGPFVVFAEFAPFLHALREIPAHAWQATASINPGDTGDAFDRDAATRWTTGQPQRGGETFTLDLGREEEIAGLTLLPGHPGDGPTGYRLERSRDGTQWERLVEVPRYFGPLFMPGPHPFVKIRQGRIEIRFPPGRWRWLRLTNLGAHASYYWSIQELFVYGPAGPARAPVNPDQLGAALTARGFRWVSADHWLSTHIRLDTGGRAGTYRTHRYANLNGWQPGPPEALIPMPDGPRAAIVIEAAESEAMGARLRALGRRPTVESADGYAILTGLEPEPLGPALPAKGWQVTASHGADQVARLHDGKPRTRWHSGAPQRPGMWVQADLGQPERLGGLKLLIPRHPTDAPRDLRVLVSDDGTRWAPVATRWAGPLSWGGQVPLRLGGAELVLAWDPLTARHVRLELGGASERWHWSIGELILHRPADRAGRSAEKSVQ